MIEHIELKEEGDSVREKLNLVIDIVNFPGLTSSRDGNGFIGYTVATLPSGSLGDTDYVKDATSPTYLGQLVGGGTIKCPVFHNGIRWVSH